MKSSPSFPSLRRTLWIINREERNTFSVLFSILEEDKTKDRDLDDSSDQGHFRGVKIGPADQIVVEDVDEV